MEPDGTLRMAISNHSSLPGIIVRGNERPPLDRPQAGIIFYNDEASEIGGLIFGGRKDAHGNVVDSGGSLSFDRYEANQIVQLIGVDDKEDKMAGLAILDSPSGTETHRRIWLGRREDGSAALAPPRCSREKAFAIPGCSRRRRHGHFTGRGRQGHKRPIRHQLTLRQSIWRIEINQVHRFIRHVLPQHLQIVAVVELVHFAGESGLFGVTPRARNFFGNLR